MSNEVDDVRTVLAAGELAVAQKDRAALKAWPARWAAASSREVIDLTQMGRAQGVAFVIVLMGLDQHSVS